MSFRNYHQNLVCLVLCLVYLSGCFIIFTSGDVCSCQPHGACNTCPSSGPCTRKNVALNKSANVSSLLNSTNEVSGPACLAVNGNLNTTFGPINNNPSNPSCVHTASGDYTPHWDVDLGQEYIISTITVYGRLEGSRNSLANATVTVDNQLCYTFASDYLHPIITEITCRSPLTGRTVRIRKVNNTERPYFAVCQVQVWVCEHGYYDPNCTNTCGNCSGGTCNPSSGECPQGCNVGYQPPYCNQTCIDGSYGLNCSRSCGNCFNGSKCNIETGECSQGCDPGYLGTGCNKLCSNGSYGLNCSQKCGNCFDGTTCTAVSGECPKGCKPGYQGALCNELCSNGSYGLNCSSSCGNCSEGTTCASVSGECPKGCKPGFQGSLCDAMCSVNSHGLNCSNTCGNCSQGTSCNPVSGECPQGCESGYQEPFCNDMCSNNSYGLNCTNSCGNCFDGATCAPVSGECPKGCNPGFQGSLCNAICSSGSYGLNCSSSCGHCYEGVTCAHVSGECPGGCKPGFQGLLCDAVCSAGVYGPNCSNGCGNCSEGTSCNATSGKCPLGCKSGYQGTFCDESCKSGTYGEECSKTCGKCFNNIGCNIVTGYCEVGCVAGYSPPYCIEARAEPQDKTSLIAGVTAACVVSFIILLVGIFLLRRRQLTKYKKYADNGAFEHEENSSRQHTSEREEIAMISLASSSDISDAKEKKPDKPRIAVKPTIVKMPSAGEVSTSHATSENIYANLQTVASNEKQTNDPGSSMDILPDVEEESANTYMNEETTYVSFKASRPQVDRVQQTLIDLLASAELSSKFEELPKGLTDLHEAAIRQENIKKNRYHTVLPYDKNRVALNDGFSEGKATDFINASYIKGFHHNRTYIAAQGPRDNTVADFWRMIWQEQIAQVIMLTSLVENGKDKCAEYWPAGNTSETYGLVKVTCVDVGRRANFFIRTFVLQMKDTKEKQKVEQLNFVAWPDHGVPTTTSLLNFWRFAKRRAPQRPPPPVLVHCTAGVGRTGTYIGLDIAYEHAVSRGDVNIYDIVKRMREERCIMVQAADQFVFLHKVVLEAYTGRDTVIIDDQFDVLFPQPIKAQKENARIDREFKKVMQMRSLTSAKRTTVAAEKSNKDKIRNPIYLPADDHLVYLTSYLPGRNQFINAVYISTYREYKGSILTQLPLKETLLDFWRLVDGCEVKVAVSLGCDNAHEDFCQFWPKDAGMSLTVDPYVIKHEAVSPVGNHLTSYTLTLQKKKVPGSRQVQLLNYTAWTGELPDDMTDLIELIDKVDAMCLENNNPAPVIIQCHDGVTRSGLFSTLWNVLSRLSLDKELDVYMAVREVHSVTPHAVTSLEQYRYCYEVAQKRVSDLSTYTNA